MSLSMNKSELLKELIRLEKLPFAEWNKSKKERYKLIYLLGIKNRNQVIPGNYYSYLNDLITYFELDDLINEDTQ